MYEVNQWQFTHNRIYYSIVRQLHVEKNSMQFSNLSKSFLSLKQTFFSWLNPKQTNKILIEHKPSYKLAIAEFLDQDHTLLYFKDHLAHINQSY